jgi:hypothetical protein
MLRLLVVAIQEGLPLRERLAAFAERYDASASVLGLFIAVIGFGVTLLAVRKARSAAEQAKIAAMAARSDVYRVDSVARISAVVAALNELKNMHRRGEWRVALPEYTRLRQQLIEVKNPHSPLEEAEISSIQSAIQHLAGIEKKVENSLDPGGLSVEAWTFNDIISAQVDRLNAILVALKSRQV